MFISTSDVRAAENLSRELRAYKFLSIFFLSSASFVFLFLLYLAAIFG